MNIEPDHDDPHAGSSGAELVPADSAGIAMPPTEDYVVVPVTAEDSVGSQAPTEFIAGPLGAFDDSAADWFDADDAYMDALTEVIVLPHDLTNPGQPSSSEIEPSDPIDDEQTRSFVAALWPKVVAFAAGQDWRKQLPRIGAIAALLSLVIGGVVAVQSKGDDRVGNTTASEDSPSATTDELTTQFGSFATTDLSSTSTTPSDVPVPTDIASTDPALPPTQPDLGTGVPSTDTPPSSVDTSVTETTTTETTTTPITTTTDQPSVSVSGSVSIQLPPWTGLNQVPPPTTVTVYVPTPDTRTTPPPAATTTPGTTPPATTTAPSTTAPPVTTTTVTPTPTPSETARCSTPPRPSKTTTSPSSSLPTLSHPPTTSPRPSTTTTPPATSKPTTTSAKPTTPRSCR
ncbi:hypothetical protein AB0L82_35790 [Nocardia sp. NPDC052001]|uniref:hypothetical protein n=1 Tax=Nocardia sp. NPDC052001 TaxID=3154853 RepID=UPI003445D7B1